MIELSEEDKARCLNAARAELGLPPAVDTPLIRNRFERRAIPTLPEPTYFAVAQYVITDPVTGEQRAVIEWRNPAGVKHAYTEALA